MQTGKLFTAAALAASLFLAAAYSKAQDNATGTNPADSKEAQQKKDIQTKDGKKTATDDWSAKHATPRDAASGQASGKRQHKPIVITSENKGTSTSSESTARDSATGKASGKRQHQPITIRKETDKSSPGANASQATQGQSTSDSSNKDDKTKNPAPPKN